MNAFVYVKPQLNIDFDVDQDGSQPFWYSARDPRGKGLQPATLELRAGETLEVIIRGRALRPSTFVDFTVTEFVLISQPQIDTCDGERVTFSLPSPLGDQSQACRVVAWSDSPAAALQPAEVTKPVYTKVEKHLAAPLSVGQTNGRWMLRVMLTVAIQRDAGPASAKRVFSFDVWTNVVGGNGEAETA